MNANADAAPWYRHPWPWFLMLAPAAAVVAGSITLAIAFSGRDGLVADDYYRQGIGINRAIAREEAAKALSIRGTVTFEAGSVSATLVAAKPLPERLKLTAAHATRDGLDRTVFLARGLDGVYRAPMAPLAPARWRVSVETDQWRVAALADTRSGGTIRLDAGAP